MSVESIVVLQKHPLPWSTKPGEIPTTAWTDRGVVLVDANGKEISLNAENLKVFAEFTTKLTKMQRRKLHDRTGLIVKVRG